MCIYFFIYKLCWTVHIKAMDGTYCSVINTGVNSYWAAFPIYFYVYISMYGDQLKVPVHRNCNSSNLTHCRSFFWQGYFLRVQIPLQTCQFTRRSKTSLKVSWLVKELFSLVGCRPTALQFQPVPMLESKKKLHHRKGIFVCCCFGF